MESSLSQSYESLLRAVGHYLGFGLDVDSYSEEQLYQADEVSIQGGLRKFYAPEPMGKMPPVQWSFLRPIMSLSLKAAVGDYDLPDDFSSLIGKVTILSTTGNYSNLLVQNEGQIREARSANTITGIPRVCAVRAKPVNKGFGQRWEMLFYPTPSTTYTIELKALVNPSKLSATNPYPYGGMQHAQTILQACLSEAEEKVQDIANGPQRVAYLGRLAASISLDAQSRGEHLGYCGDPGTPECYQGQQRGIWTDRTSATYNGVSY